MPNLYVYTIRLSLVLYNGMYTIRLSAVRKELYHSEDTVVLKEFQRESVRMYVDVKRIR